MPAFLGYIREGGLILINTMPNPKYKSQHAWKKRNPERVREYKKNYDLKYPEKRNARNKRFKLNHPDYYQERIAYYQGPKGKYREYKASARQRKIEWKLTHKDFKKIWQRPCIYCGTEIKTIGVDRINNSLGYTKENCVPCCTRCNKMKSGLSAPEFIRHCQRILRHYKGRKYLN